MCKLKLGFLKLGVASATAVPNSQDFDATVPVVVEDANGTVLTDEVDLASGATDELAVVSQVANVKCCKVDVFFENQHA